MWCTRKASAHAPLLWSTVRGAHQTPKELSIKVPWGTIAGLHWNEKTSAIPVLCAHGWKDNAASFSRVIPLILRENSDYQFIALDLPGHGRTSHYPTGMMYQYLDVLGNFRRIIEHFGWGKSGNVCGMGHSLGAQLVFLLAASHPEIVKTVIGIDGLFPVPYTTTDLAKALQARDTNAFKYTEKSAVLGIRAFTDALLATSVERPQRTFSRDDLLKVHIKFTKALIGLDDANCELLFERVTIENPPGSGKFMFSHDARVLTYPIMGISPKQCEDIAKCYQGNLLYIEGPFGAAVHPPVLTDWLKQNNTNTVKKVCEKARLHHLHLTEPEKIAKDILDFFKELK